MPFLPLLPIHLHLSAATQINSISEPPALPPLQPKPAMKLAQVFVLVGAPQKQLSLPIVKIIPSSPVPFFHVSSVHLGPLSPGQLGHSVPSELREAPRSCRNMTCILLLYFCATRSLVGSGSEQGDVSKGSEVRKIRKLQPKAMLL